MKKLTIEEVKEFVEGENGNGCKLISTEYNGQYATMNFKCKCCNKFETHLNAFKSGNKRQCNECGKALMIKNKLKYTPSYIKEFISKYNCKLLTVDCTHSTQDIKVMCLCGDIFNTTFSHFKEDNQRQCNQCGYKKTADKLKFSYEDVKYNIESTNNCRLVSIEYKDQLQKLEIECSCGNIFNKTFKDFKAGQNKCNDCAGKFFYTIDDVKEYIEKNSNSILLSTIYKDQKTKIKTEMWLWKYFSKDI
ncbi:hypothetical protein LGL55_05875 [Clostridium tagluense]|uniref:hypothetical protein n=1 Tax=Clostridium tagluense TaxID=360422 RepID=UPI001CF3EAD5|nr:hypothetical protein [Clostridium tagluense]MCB2310650.1 hypothetical protein [Clostridium tagluense]MCB2315619.1 hypothetical protein [Clostridium tagluense]MCB2320473.1 hypothetical protein [Clostridium tagluense]MCB2325244.1 hypothetical protein [Clostridium tagluense]MCB2330096.1 hypothetical protein [Clostridium tagluense]